LRTSDVERVLFTLVLLTGIAVLTHQMLELGPIARRVPLVVAVPTLVLLGIQLLLDLVDGGIGRRAPREATELYKVVGVPEKTRSALAASPAGVSDKYQPARVELVTFAWLLLLPALILLLGVLVATPAFTLLYLRVGARERWLLSLGMAAVIGSLPYGLFRILLSVPLYKGQLWAWLGLGS
jgi:hypothetical protein